MIGLSYDEEYQAEEKKEVEEKSICVRQVLSEPLTRFRNGAVTAHVIDKEPANHVGYTRSFDSGVPHGPPALCTPAGLGISCSWSN